MSKILTSALSACLLSFAFVSISYSPDAQAQSSVYKWVDKKGVTHYSDKPNSLNGATEMKFGKKEVTLTSEDLTQTSSPSTEDPTKDWEVDSNGNKVAPNRQAACDVAKRNVEVLSDPAQIPMRHDAEGRPTILQGKEKEEQLNKAKSEVEKFCE